MIKLSKKYKNLIKKYTPNEILNMYRDNKIELNSKEWKDIHRRLDKKNNIYYGFKISTVFTFIFCVLLLIFIAPYMSTSNHEKIKNCNELKGHTCTRYEIESMGD